MGIINEEKKNQELKESIRMMKSQRSDTEKNNLVEEGKKNRNWWGYETQEFQKLIMLKQWFYQNVQYVVVKRFIKKQEASGILSNLGLKTPLNKIPLLGDRLF